MQIIQPTSWFYLNRPAWGPFSLYAVPLIFGITALLTRDPVIRMVVPLAVPLVTFLSLAWWADFRQTQALLREMVANADALIVACRGLIERDLSVWQHNPIRVSVSPDVTSATWEVVTERVRTDPSLKAVGVHHDAIAVLYAQIYDLPIMAGTSRHRRNSQFDASTTLWGVDPTLPSSIFQCCLVYLALAEALYAFVAAGGAPFGVQSYREQQPWIARARDFLKEADIAWNAHLKTNPDDNVINMKAAFDKQLKEFLEAYNRGP